MTKQSQSCEVRLPRSPAKVGSLAMTLLERFNAFVLVIWKFELNL
jgi:hypothetical protein